MKIQWLKSKWWPEGNKQEQVQDNAEKVAKRPLPKNNNKSNEKYPKTSRCAAVKRVTVFSSSQAQIECLSKYFQQCIVYVGDR